MKISDSRLDSIRSLVKQLSTQKKEVGAAEGVGGATDAAGVEGSSGTGSSGEVSAAGYGELHHSVEQKQLARDVQLVLEATDPARDTRIEELKARIDAGEYSVDSESIAERLLASGVMAEGE